VPEVILVIEKYEEQTLAVLTEFVEAIKDGYPGVLELGVVCANID
jgi:hypothetical protein